MADGTDHRSQAGEAEDLLDDAGVGSTVDVGHEPTEEESPRRGLRDRIRSPVEGLFSPRMFLIVLAVTLVGSTVAGTVVPLGGLAGLVGIAAVAFGVGLVDTTPRYLELCLAGAIAAGLGAVLDQLVLTLLGAGVPLLALGAVSGGLAGIVGHYFGRDLRAGLTRDL